MVVILQNLILQLVAHTFLRSIVGRVEFFIIDFLLFDFYFQINTQPTRKTFQATNICLLTPSAPLH
jgi:hypothetical protein